MVAQPSLFISHGGPNIVTDETLARTHLAGLASTLPEKPSAIVIASAHFEANGPSVVADAKPGMIYDFGGFAPELYQIDYPAPGDPALAVRIKDMLDDAGLGATMVVERGYDHGTWTTMLLAFPKADIPIVQVSIDPHRDAAYHFQLGAALAPLGQRNILVIGSGHITHNLRAVFSVMRGGAEPDGALENKVLAFTGWVADTLSAGDTETLLAWREMSPYPRENHPTDEHFMPLFFAAGAAGDGAVASRIHASRQFGFFAFDCYRFNRAPAP